MKVQRDILVLVAIWLVTFTLLKLRDWAGGWPTIIGLSLIAGLAASSINSLLRHE